MAAFNLACAHSLRGNLDEARKALASAIALDRAKFSKSAREDPDLAALRADPRFKELVK